VGWERKSKKRRGGGETTGVERGGDLGEVPAGVQNKKGKKGPNPVSCGGKLGGVLGGGGAPGGWNFSLPFEGSSAGGAPFFRFFPHFTRLLCSRNNFDFFPKK